MEHQADSLHEAGATAVEYGLLLALVAAAIVATVSIFGGQVLGLFVTVEEAF